MERCWQRYGGKLVGPEEKTGRKEDNKAHFVYFRFLAVRFLACLVLLSLSCVWCCVAVSSYRAQPAAGVTLGSGRPASGQLSSAGGVGLQRPTQERAAKRRASEASKK